MIDDIKQNVENEITLVQQIETLITLQDKSSPQEITMLREALQSARARMKLINDAIPEMVRSISLVKKLGSTPKPIGIERVTVKKLDQRVAIRSQDKESFLQQLNISEKLLAKIRKQRDTSSELSEDYSRSNPYARLSNAVFLRYAKSSMAKGDFKDLALDLRKANLNVLTASYISILFFTTLLAGVIGVMLGIFLWFFTISINAPFILPNQMEILQRIALVFAGFIVPPLIAFGALYIYPSVERRSIASRIDSELPFVVIHMGSISGSGVEPTQIFKIVGLSKEYPYTRGEIRKVINQINVYGYDLITALKNIARLTPSQRLSELLGGMASSITSGGDMQTFFERRAETLLFNYRIERENFTKVAETFMDLYISIVIATPMILLLLLVMISVSGISVGLGVNHMTLLIIFIVAIVNIIFLWILSIRQPNY